MTEETKKEEVLDGSEQSKEQDDIIDELFGAKEIEYAENARFKLGDGSQSKLFKNVAIWSFVGGLAIGGIVLLVIKQFFM